MLFTLLFCESKAAKVFNVWKVFKTEWKLVNVVFIDKFNSSTDRWLSEDCTSKLQGGNFIVTQKKKETHLSFRCLSLDCTICFETVAWCACSETVWNPHLSFTRMSIIRLIKRTFSFQKEQNVMSKYHRWAGS